MQPSFFRGGSNRGLGVDLTNLRGKTETRGKHRGKIQLRGVIIVKTPVGVKEAPAPPLM